VFRGEGALQSGQITVALGEFGHSTLPPTEPGAPPLNAVFSVGLAAMEREGLVPLERGLAFFLFGALQQFFVDGNKRTARFMMNGILMAHGIDAISVPAARKLEFNEKMRRFYVSKEGSEMMQFLVSCLPASLISSLPLRGVHS